MSERAALYLVDAPTEQPSTPLVDQEPKCWRCRRKLADYCARPWAFTCPRCKAENHSPPIAA